MSTKEDGVGAIYDFSYQIRELGNWGIYDFEMRIADLQMGIWLWGKSSFMLLWVPIMRSKGNSRN